MIVTLDGNRVEQQFDGDGTLQAVIDAVRAEQMPDRLVVGVSLNGQECGDDELAERLTQPVADIEQIDLQSGDPAALGADALHTVADQLKLVAEQQQAIADQLARGEVAEGVTRVGEFVQVWQRVQQVLMQICQLTGRNLLEEQVAGATVNSHLSDVLDRLRELRDALECQDMVLLGDLIQYETPSICNTWHDLLHALADGLAESAE